MNTEILTSFFGWSAIINYTILLVWFIAFSTAHKWLYNLHNLWFEISYEKFDYIHYFSMAIFKIIIFIFNITPYVVLKFIL